MSAFSEQDFDASLYSDFRPSYPARWYQAIKEFHTADNRLAIDIGCGPGTATFDLFRSLGFETVIGADISAPMVEKAQAKARGMQLTPQNIDFVQYDGDIGEDLMRRIMSRDQNLTEDVRPSLVTMAQCVHWMDWDRTMKDVAHILAPGGTLAICGYVDPVFVDFPGLDAAIEELQYAPPPAGLGPYWEMPGRQILRDLLPNPVPTAYFSHIKSWRHDVRKTSVSESPLIVEKTMTLAAFESYIETWSSYHNWKSEAHLKTHPGYNPATAFMNKAYSTTKLTSRDTIKVAWKTVAILARRTL